MIWPVVLVVVAILGLAHLWRHREGMTTAQMVMWAAAIALLPFVGLVGYLFWQLEHSDAMQSAMSGRRDQAAPFLQDPEGHGG